MRRSRYTCRTAASSPAAARVSIRRQWRLSRSGSTANVQTLEWYQPAVIEVTGQFGTTGTASMPAGGLTGGMTRADGPFGKIIQLFGHATSGVDVEVVANSGMHGPVISML